MGKPKTVKKKDEKKEKKQEAKEKGSVSIERLLTMYNECMKKADDLVEAASNCRRKIVEQLGEHLDALYSNTTWPIKGILVGSDGEGVLCSFLYEWISEDEAGEDDYGRLELGVDIDHTYIQAGAVVVMQLRDLEAPCKEEKPEPQTKQENSSNETKTE